MSIRYPLSDLVAITFAIQAAGVNEEAREFTQQSMKAVYELAQRIVTAIDDVTAHVSSALGLAVMDNRSATPPGTSFPSSV